MIQGVTFELSPRTVQRWLKMVQASEKIKNQNAKRKSEF